MTATSQPGAHAVALVTGAGFGPAATETLVLRLVEQLGAVPDLVRVAAAAQVTRQSDGVRQTVQESLARGAANVVAYIANPAARSSGTGSCTWAEVTGPDGHTVTAELRTGEGVRATAAIAAETTRRVLAGVKPGAWTAGQLFGAALVTDATGARLGDYQQAIDIYRDLGNRPDEADTLSRLGDALHGSGDTEAARRAWLDALHIYGEIDHPDAGEIRAKLQPPGTRTESGSG